MTLYLSKTRMLAGYRLSPQAWAAQWNAREMEGIFSWLLQGMRSHTQKNILRVIECNWQHTGELTEKQWALLQRWAEEKE